MRGATFVDTNVFLRFLLNDHATHSDAARLLIDKIEKGELLVWTSHLVIAEIVWTLSSKPFGFSREAIAGAIGRLLSFPTLQTPRKQIFRRVFALYTTQPIDYIDAYHAALLERSSNKQLYSFDRHFDKVAGLERIEPEEADLSDN